MATTTMTTPSGSTFQIQREMIEVTSWAERPNPDWSATDSHGHVHTQTSDTYHWVVTDRWWNEDDSEWLEDGEYRCNLCDEVVVPGTLPPSMSPEYISGPVHYLINDVPVSEPDFKAAFEVARREFET